MLLEFQGDSVELTLTVGLTDPFLAFTAIKVHSPTKPTLVFVSSRRQTRLTALDLISYLAGDDNPKQWMHMEEQQVRRRGEDLFSGFLITREVFHNE